MIHRRIGAESISFVDARRSALRRSVLGALAYAGLFQYPLTVEELARYQVGSCFTLGEITEALAGDEALAREVSCSDGYYSLAEHEAYFAQRAQREAASRLLWRKARRYARWLARLPFVRMVAVTGALAVSNVAARPDIDLLVVAEPGRVWVCRRLLITAVRFARIWRDELCPNYILSEGQLALEQRDFFTAHELAQMAPLSGLAVYTRMLESNKWAYGFLPGAFGAPAKLSPALCKETSSSTKLVERLLGARLFDRWERWEMGRLQAKLRPLIGEAAEVVCSPAQCKGHTSFHRRSTMLRYQEELYRLDLLQDFAYLFEAGS